MRSWLMILVLLGISSTAAAQAARMEDDGVPRVVATASKTARLAPDRVTVYATVEGSAESAAEASQRADRKLQTVTDAVRQLGGRVELSSTTPFGIMPAPNYGGFPAASTTSQLVARYIVRVQPARLDQLMSVASALLTAGATAVTPPTFDASGADSTRRAKFTESVAQAKADAEALAAAMGMRLGALIEVVGNVQPPRAQFEGPYFSFGRGFDFGGPGPTPEVVVTSSVTVRYRLQPR